MKKYIVVTGGCGFVGMNLIQKLIKDTKFGIISIDDLSSGTEKNKIKNNRIQYIKAHTKDINKILDRYKLNIFQIIVLSFIFG